MSDRYRFHNLKYGMERTAELRLYWEAAGDPITDDYTTEDADARELWRLWVKGKTDPIVPLYWIVEGENDGIFEGAPFQPNPLSDESFLTFFSWPVHVDTGERVNWLALPVDDKLWRGERMDKGGFIQEASGWKPSPLQASMDLRSFAGAGLPVPFTR